MLSNKPLVALSQAERQLLQYQRRQRGRCVRCFHASIRRHAEDTGADSGKEGESITKSNQVNRSPSRHQRAAMVSEEVRMLSRNVSSLGSAKPQNESVGFEGAAQQTEQEASSGRMGENNSQGREGPQAQGVGKPVRSIDDEVDGTVQVRGTRSPSGALEEPTQGGASVMGGEARVAADNQQRTTQDLKVAGESAETGRSDRSSLETTVQRTSATTSLSPAGPRIPGPGQPVQPMATSKEQYLHSGSNTSTIAAANYEGVIRDRIRASADPAGLPGHRSTPELAHRFMRKKLVQSESKEQIRAMDNLLREHKSGSQALSKAEMIQEDKGLTSSRFRPLPKTIRDHLMESIVKGVYDSEGLLGDTPKHKQPVLNGVAKMTMMNGTYLNSDGERLLKKVQSLLPISPVTPQRRGGTDQARPRK